MADHKVNYLVRLSPQPPRLQEHQLVRVGQQYGPPARLPRIIQHTVPRVLKQPRDARSTRTQTGRWP